MRFIVTKWEIFGMATTPTTQNFKHFFQSWKYRISISNDVTQFGIEASSSDNKMIVVLFLFIFFKLDLACPSGYLGDQFASKLDLDTKKVHTKENGVLNLKSNDALVYSNDRLLGRLDSEAKPYEEEDDGIFNLESDPAIKLALQFIDKSIRNHVSRDGSDFSIIIHMLVYFSIAIFDSIAPYDRFTVGILR